MATAYRDQPRWISNSKREAALATYKRLELGAAFLESVIGLASEQVLAQNAAIAAGVDPVLARFGPRAAEKAEEMAAPDEDAARCAAEAPAPKKPRPHIYVPRVSAPPLVVLGVRAAEMIKRLVPLIEAKFFELVDRYKIDPRRMIADDTEARMAALMLDELGIQYHEIGATAEARLRDAMNKIETWIRQSDAAQQEAAQQEGGPEQSGPPAANENAHGSGDPCHEPQGPATNAETHGSGDPCHEPQSRAPQTYSAGGESLDWTRLR